MPDDNQGEQPNWKNLAAVFGSVCEALEPLSPDERQRVLRAAEILLLEPGPTRGDS